MSCYTRLTDRGENMKNFIYVFTEKDRDKLKQLGFSLLKDDAQNSIFIFASKINGDFSYESLDAAVDRYCFSNTLTF